MRNVKLKAKRATKSREELSDEDIAPPLRWHNVNMDWDGARRRFAMTISEDELGAPVIELGIVYTADEARDEWVEAHHRILAKARADEQLMISLRSQVEMSEKSRIADEMAESEWR